MWLWPRRKLVGVAVGVTVAENEAMCDWNVAHLSLLEEELYL